MAKKKGTDYSLMTYFKQLLEHFNQLTSFYGDAAENGADNVRLQRHIDSTTQHLLQIFSILNIPIWSHISAFSSFRQMYLSPEAALEALGWWQNDDGTWNESGDADGDSFTEGEALACSNIKRH